MEFRIADTFTDSLARLTGEEQKSVKTTAFDLQLNPANPGLQFHKLEKARDPRFWSVRVNLDLRLIVHRTESSLLLCYVNHHDQAYHWAERRKLETHPKTGAAQLIEIRETVQEIVVPKYIKPALFADLPDSELMGYGVPPEWLPEVRKATEDTILELAGHLPGEAAEALLDLAIGATPRIPQPAPAGANPFEHPDAQRRFRTLHSTEELERALSFPWEKWTVFLHPAQRQLVERDYNGPARVSGSAGTGKTIVALHRAVFLAKSNPAARVLLTTFSDTLANALRIKLRYLILNEPRLGERIEVHSIDTIARRLYELRFGRAALVSPETLGQLLGHAAASLNPGHAAQAASFSPHFLQTEWEQVVDAWQLTSWESYRDVTRLGRKTRLPEKQRAALWAIFSRVHDALKSRSLITSAALFTRLANSLAAEPSLPFEFTVIDEAQDVTIPQLRFLAALGSAKPNRLFFTGDLGQRIFQQPFSWKALGADIRGRSFTLRINYRTSHQIRSSADKLLGSEISDVDGNTESRKGTVSVFNGPAPHISVLDSPEREAESVADWLKDRMSAGIAPPEIGIFVRSEAELPRAICAAKAAGLPFKLLDRGMEPSSGKASIGAMHLAKGLEFRAVVVMACDDEIIPSQQRIETVTDDSDLEEVYSTERHLLYVACTRARDHLLVTGAKPASEFLEDLKN